MMGLVKVGEFVDNLLILLIIVISEDLICYCFNLMLLDSGV